MYEMDYLPSNPRGAKTAMTLALHEPDLIANLISVDNAPVDARIDSDFGRYIQGMKKIDEAGVTRQAEADKILEPYEKVSPHPFSSFPSSATLPPHTNIRPSPSQSANSSSVTCTARPTGPTRKSSASRSASWASPSTTSATSPSRTRPPCASLSPRSSSAAPRASTSRTR